MDNIDKARELFKPIKENLKNDPETLSQIVDIIKLITSENSRLQNELIEINKTIEELETLQKRTEIQYFIKSKNNLENLVSTLKKS
jgi:hypothetical protein